MSIKVLTKIKAQRQDRERESVRACMCVRVCVHAHANRREEYMQSSSVRPLVCMDMKVNNISLTFSVILLFSPCTSLFINKDNLIQF